MAEQDLSKIINLIMENPDIIERIKNLGKDENKEGESEFIAPTEQKAGQKGEEKEITPPPKHSRRRELIYALKPYLSDERGRAIETMLSITDVLDMMKTR